MVTIIFLSMAAVCAVLYAWKRASLKKGNHYHSRRRVEPAVKVDQSLIDVAENASQKDPLIESTRAMVSKAAAIHQSVKTASSSQQADHLVVFYLIAPSDSAFVGYELLQALLSAGLRYGKQHIFHRHAHKDGRGPVLFHCAQAVAPGVFDLSKMGALSCPGLTLFFNAKEVQEPVAAFDCLLETMDQLVDDLGGKVLDARRALLTRDRMMQLRQELQTLEKHKTTADLFD